MTEKNWGDDPMRAPPLNDGDSLIYDECGRVIDNVCHRSHYFRLVLDKSGWAYLLVRHGGGDERIQLKSSHYAPRVVRALLNAESDDRYIMLRTIHDLHRDTKNRSRDAAIAECKQAFVDGRLKKRKLPRQQAVKVWIEPKKDRYGCTPT